jgi:U-box domain
MSTLDNKQEIKEREVKQLESKQSAPTREPLILHGFTCHITKDLMQDPVVTADGHNYERVAIQAWFARGKRTSPATGLPLPHLVLTPNVNLKQAIADFLKQEPEFAKVKELERASKTQEQIHQDLLLAIQLREQELEARLAKQAELGEGKKEEKYDHSNAMLLSRQGLLRNGSQETEQQVGKTVLHLVNTLEQYLPTVRGYHFETGAAAGYVATLVSALAKRNNDPQALKRMFETPEENSLPKPVALFISNYVAQNPILHEITQRPDFGKSLKLALIKNETVALRARFNREETVSSASTASSSSSLSSSSASSSSSSSSDSVPSLNSLSI